MGNQIASVLGDHIKVRFGTQSGSMPVTISSTQKIDFIQWAKSHKDDISDILTKHGAILFTGMTIGGSKEFNEVFSEIIGEPLPYVNRTSPRDQVYEKVYTSTTYPSDQPINMHTENSYSKTFNRIIAFFCNKPADKGGETPIADEREIIKLLSLEELQEFRKKGIMYERNIIEGGGLDWQTTYQTSDKNVLHDILDKNNISYRWIDDYHLRLNWVLPAFQIHPVTKQEVWFNHMYFYHKSQYDPDVVDYFGEQSLPFTSYYGDGTDIEEEVVAKIKDFYTRQSILYTWKKDDMLLLDNMLFSHGRQPYEGERSILAAMGISQDFVN